MNNIKDVIFFGTGGVAEKFYLENHDKINLVYCLDNDMEKQGGLFHGKPIYSFKEYLNKYKYKYLIIITSSFYESICRQLINEGLMEYEDFIYCEFYLWGFNRKKVVIFGNCHANAIKDSLLRNKFFLNEYIIYNIKPIQLINIGEEYNCLKKYLNKCDLFIHQSVRRENGFGEKFCSEELLKYISNKCEVISIPNLFGLGYIYFLQIGNEQIKNSKVFFRFNDKNADKMIKEGRSTMEIISFLSGEVYSRDYVEKNFNDYISKFEEREKEWDIKIMDYIKENYKKQKLFYDLAHPISKVIEKISERLVKYLNIKYSNNEIYMLSNKYIVDRYELIIYPCVYKYLNLEFDNIIENKRRIDEFGNKYFFKNLDFKNYIKEYVNSRILMINEDS